MNSTVLVFGGVWVEAQIRLLMLRVQGFGFVEFVGCDSSLALMDFFNVESQYSTPTALKVSPESETFSPKL